MRIRTSLAALLAATSLAATSLVAGCGNAPGAAPGGANTQPAGNGVAELSAQEILTRSQQALDGASSFQVKGTTKQDGDELSVDLIVNGDDRQATIVINGQTMEVTEIGGTAYVKLPEMFLSMIAMADPGVAALAKEKYIKIAPNDQRFSEFAAFADLTDNLLKTGDPAGATKGATRTVNGTPAIGIALAGATVWVATEGEPYPLRMEPSDGATGLDFSNFNSAPKVQEPPAAEVLDTAALGAATG